MNYTALSLSQAPPLSVPLRFFLTAPLFIVVAALILVTGDSSLLLSRWSPTVLALTHLITLGFLGMCMVGAVQQLMPVLIGTPLKSPRLVATLLHLPMTLGVTALVAGMGFSRPGLLQLGALILLPALLYFIVTIAHCLWRTSSRHATVTAISVAISSLLVVGLIALWLLWFGKWQVPLAHPNTALHIGWGTVGWIGALLIGVAYQVVPMFQITPEYPPRLRRLLLPAMLLILFGWSFSRWWQAGPELLLGHLLALLLLLFALQTLRLQERRRRRLADVTLNFWRLSMGCLGVAVIMWASLQWFAWGRGELLLGVVFLLGFAYSAVNGMLYKIVPFLVWLHLNNQLQAQGSWQGGVPHMKQIIAVSAMQRQFRLHLLALAVLLLTVVLPDLLPTWIAGLLWLLNAFYLWWNLMQALRCYRNHLPSTPAAAVST